MAARLLSEVNGLMYRTEADRQWYVRKFRTRPLLPNLRHFPHAFEKYDPVRMFYANIRVTSVFPLELETQVLGHFIRLTPQLLSRVHANLDFSSHHLHCPNCIFGLLTLHLYTDVLTHQLSSYNVKPVSSNSTLEASFSPDGMYVISSSCDGSVHAWSIRTGKEVIVGVKGCYMVSNVA
ncbi:hypothetical protein LINPERHAP1_LOCUS22388 [Linum perenne]